MDLSIIIVNWKSVGFLRTCLKSIAQNAKEMDFEVLVIDNASYDGSADLIANEFPSVSFIQSHKNLGFAGGNNLAFQRAQGDYVLFLNPDAEIVGDALHGMLDVLKSRAEAGVVGPKLVNPDLSVQTDCMRSFPTILKELFDSSLSRRWFAEFRWWGVAPVMSNGDGPVCVEMLPGTCMMLRREIFEAAGKFNEQYFMYAEDVELNYRVRSAGLTNYLMRSALVVHYGGRSSSQKTESEFSTVMMRESMWKFFRNSRGKSYAFIYRLTTALAAVGRILVLTMVRVLSFNARVPAAQSTRKWIKVLRWCAGRETWVCRYRPVSVTDSSAEAAKAQS